MTRTPRRAGRSRLAAALLATSLAGAPSAVRGQAPRQPATRTDTTAEVYAGTRVPAPYRWLADTASTDVQAWLDAQNRLVRRNLDDSPLRARIAARLDALPAFENVGFPKRGGERVYYSVSQPGDSRAVVYAIVPGGGARAGGARDAGTPRAGEPVPVIDATRRWPDDSTRLIGYRTSPAARLLVYQLHSQRTGENSFHLLDLGTGRDLPDTLHDVERASSYSWSRDGRGFVYDRPVPGGNAEPPSADNEAYYHVVGTPQSADRLVYAEHDRPEVYVGAGITASGRYLILNLWDTKRGVNRISYIDLGDPLHPDVGGAIRPLLTKEDGTYIWLREIDDELLIQTTKDAPNGRVVAVPFGQGADPRQRIVVPESKERLREASVVGGRVAALYDHDVASRIVVYSTAGEALDTVALPGIGTASLMTGSKDAAELFFRFSSPVRPAAWYRYDLDRRTLETVGPAPTLLDTTRYETREEFATSADGTRVPIFISSRKDVPLDGSNRTALNAYGAFGTSVYPQFVAEIVPWLEMGGVYAQAAVRGGGDYGQAWHEAGMRERKRNAVDDVVAAAEHLVRRGYTDSTHLALMGVQAGGLLVGAAIERRPGLFAAAYVRSGLLDLLGYDRSAPGSGWTDEFGSARDSAALPWLRELSPLHNVRPGVCYPALLATVAERDPRSTTASASYRFVARLQSAQACDRPVLLRTDEGTARVAGEPLPGGRPADAWGFLARETGPEAAGGARPGDGASRPGDGASRPADGGSRPAGARNGPRPGG